MTFRGGSYFGATGWATFRGGSLIKDLVFWRRGEGTGSYAPSNLTQFFSRSSYALANLSQFFSRSRYALANLTQFFSRSRVLTRFFLSLALRARKFDRIFLSQTQIFLFHSRFCAKSSRFFSSPSLRTPKSAKCSGRAVRSRRRPKFLALANQLSSPPLPPTRSALAI